MVSEEQNSDIELASEVIPVPQVQPKIEAPAVINETNEVTNDIPPRKPRQRKRALYNAILKQMEFYFSDSNLSKDRFLAGLIKECPDIPLDTFLRFNKIRSLTNEVSKIAKALSNSTMLQVSEDGKTVRRITPIRENHNVDECTVYVQRLPSDADHEWLQTLFSEYGPVAYVSLPKYKVNQKIKGFAFIEFQTPESAQKCLKAFRTKGCELPSHTSPTEVLSITTFAEEEKQEKNGIQTTEQVVHNDNEKNIEKSVDSEEVKAKKRRVSTKSDENKEYDDTNKESSTILSDSNTEKEEKHGKKRKIRHSTEETLNSDAELQKVPRENSKKRKKGESEDIAESESSVQIETEKDCFKKRKKSKIEVDSESENSLKNETEKECIKKKKKSKPDVSEIVAEPENNTENETVKKEKDEETLESANEDGVSEKKKKKKRKRKNHSTFEVLQTVDMGLQVMGKKDWKKLRNKYLELQRAKMKQLKQNIKKARWNQWGDKYRMETEHEETSDHKKENQVGNKKENPASTLQFIPNVIVKIELNEPCIDPKGFKTELKASCNNIKYIDIKEGSHEAYVRCDSSETATTLAQKSNDERHFRVLNGDEELFYWDKISRDREEKIGNKVRVNQRGRNKLLKKAEKELGKHIKFDEV